MAIEKFDDIVRGFSTGSVDEAVLYGSFSNMADTGTAGVLCSSTNSPFAPWMYLPTGDTLLIDASSHNQGYDGSLTYPPLLCDLLWYVTWYSYGNRRLSGDYIPFSQPPLTRYSSGDGVFPVFIPIRTSTSIGNFTIALRVTDSTGATGNGLRCGYEADLTPRTVLMAPPYGSTGVRAIEGFTLSNSDGFSISESFGFMFALVKPIRLLPVVATHGICGQTFSEMASNIARLPSGSAGDKPCLVLLGWSRPTQLAFTGV